MRIIYALGKRFVTILGQEGLSVALRTLCNFLANEYFKLKYRLLVRYYTIFHRGLILREIAGNKMYLSVNDSGLSRELLLHNIREPLQTRLVKQLVKPGMTVLDIGANLGYYVLMEAEIVGEMGKVYAIEPIKRNYDILEKNVRINDYNNIVDTHLCAVSDTCGVSKIAVTKESNFSTMFLNKYEMSEWMEKQLEISTERIVDVETVTVDEFLVDRRPPDFIRMDVEGYEGTIIKGMSRTLRNSGHGLKLFIELHSCIFTEPRTTLEEIVRNLTNSGLEIKHVVNTDGTEFLDFSMADILETLCGESAPAIFLEKT